MTGFKDRCRAIPWPWTGWSVLRTAPRELWMVFIIKFLQTYSYFCLELNLTLFLTNELEYSDQGAGWVYGIHGVIIGIVSIVLGFAIDMLQIKWSILIGLVFNLVGRILVFAATSRPEMLIALYLLLPVAEALGVPVLTIAVKRYTNKSNASVAFGFYYVVMNVAALVAANVTTAVLSEISSSGVQIFGQTFSATRIIYFTNIIVLFLAILLSLPLRSLDLQEDGSVTLYTPETVSFLTRTIRTLTNPHFLRMTVFMLLVMVVRIIYRVLDAGFPKYFERMFDSHAWGSIEGINMILVIFLVPFTSLYLQGYDHVTIIVTGSFIVSASTFILIVPTIPATVGFIVVLSIGESLYSPRLYNYMMDMSPVGEEGVFSAFASIPMFLAKFIVGPLSGFLLELYCPGVCTYQSTMTSTNSSMAVFNGTLDVSLTQAPCNICPQPQYIWIVIGGISMIGPVVMFLIRHWLLADLVEPVSNQTKYSRLAHDVGEEHINMEELTQDGKVSARSPQPSTPCNNDGEDDDSDEDFHPETSMLISR